MGGVELDDTVEIVDGSGGMRVKLERMRVKLKEERVKLDREKGQSLREKERCLQDSGESFMSSLLGSSWLHLLASSHFDSCWLVSNFDFIDSRLSFDLELLRIKIHLGIWSTYHLRDMFYDVGNGGWNVFMIGTLL